MYDLYNGEYPEAFAFEDLIGKTLVSISRENNDHELRLTAEDGSVFIMWHAQDCCESVYIEDVAGDLDDLIGSPILQAEAACNSDDPPLSEWEESYTWTFYKLATIRGGVTIRWYGSSNGYYSEGVSFARLTPPQASSS